MTIKFPNPAEIKELVDAKIAAAKVEGTKESAVYFLGKILKQMQDGQLKLSERSHQTTAEVDRILKESLRDFGWYLTISQQARSGCQMEWEWFGLPEAADPHNLAAVQTSILFWEFRARFKKGFFTYEDHTDRTPILDWEGLSGRCRDAGFDYTKVSTSDNHLLVQLREYRRR